MDKEMKGDLQTELDNRADDLKKLLKKVKGVAPIAGQVHQAHRKLLLKKEWILLDSVIFGLKEGDVIESFWPHNPSKYKMGQVTRDKEDCHVGTLVEYDSDEERISVFIDTPDITGTHAQPEPDANRLSTGMGVQIRLKKVARKKKEEVEDGDNELKAIVLD
jgi:hypothetical protein